MPMPDIWCYGVDKMSGGDRKEFLAWYETRNSQLFDNRHVLEAYCQDDVTVIRKACRVFDATSYKAETLRFFSSP